MPYINNLLNTIPLFSIELPLKVRQIKSYYTDHVPCNCETITTLKLLQSRFVSKPLENSQQLVPFHMMFGEY